MVENDKEGFNEVMIAMRDKIKVRLTKDTYEPVEIDKRIDLSWMGTR
jgi:hypothetical protein